MKKIILKVYAQLLVISTAVASLLLMNVAVADTATGYVNQSSPLGINTNEAMEVDASLPFVDLFRYALPFESARPWLTKGKIDYDQDGWPKNLHGGQAGTRFLSHIPAEALPKGVYTVRYDGQGRLRYGASVKLIKRLPGRDLVRLEPLADNTITATLFIEKSDPKDYLRNIRVLMSGGICLNDPMKRVDEASQCDGRPFMSFADHHRQVIFNPDYLNFMKDFKVVRFMNMAGITRNNIQHWKDRPSLTKATWGGPEGQRGVPVEIMVELANQLNVNPWFNMPHGAADDYVIGFAQYVKQHLKPSLKIYIEYTNEAWNAVFVPQAEHMKQNGTRQKLDSDRRVAGFKYYSKQSVHIFKLWEKIFGGTDRLVRVMGGMTTDPAMSETILAYQKAYQHVDALAIAPYFYIAQDKLKSITQTDQVFELLSAADNRYSIHNLMKIIRQQSEVAKAYGVDLVAYEGGQHLVDHKTHKLTEGATPYLVAANRDPRMAREYYRFLSDWKSVGGNLFIAFSAPRPHTWHGSWGIKEYINQPNADAPKYQALLAFNRGERCWWQGCETGEQARLPKPGFIPQHLATGNAPAQRDPSSVTIQRGSASSLRKVPAHRIATLMKGTINDVQDLSAMWRAVWDERGLHIWVGVHDERLVKDSKQLWADDSIEIYLDADGSRQDKFDGKDDFQMTFRMNDDNISLGGSSPQQDTSDIQYEMLKTKTGYHLEASIPWRLLKVTPKAGMRMGFDVQVNDDDNGHYRDAKISWNAAVDQAWKNPSVFGQIILGE
ncbi:MAG: hypothetical protein CSB47_03460 [Proteobacteria bacterium]|nr:MAG: hypothetical protein CSB47_03460 [Pseudomonadota bacterium]